MASEASRIAVLEAELAAVKLQLAGAPAADAASEADGKDHKRAQTRLTKAAEKTITEGHIGGDFKVTPDPSFLETRIAEFEKAKARAAKEAEARERRPITITLPNGDTKDGVAFETTPLEIASGISAMLAKSVCVAKVKYTDDKVTAADLETGEDGIERDEEDADPEGDLWDLTRPLVGSCNIKLLKFDEKDAKMVFWHSSAHMLGQCLEHKYGAHLTIGPPIQDGFYYDAYMGSSSVADADRPAITDLFKKSAKESQEFERLSCTKEELLRIFADNPFKQQIIRTKIPDGTRSTVYRNGDLIDLCRGPHIPDTGRVKAFSVVRNTATNWLGDTDNDPLQRVYGISFPDKKQLKEWERLQEMAKERDHRKIGTEQQLFTFSDLSPGSAFFLPHGARLYNKLIEFIREEYWKRGYEEVVSPNIFNLDLWRISGHAQLYKDDMFVFDCEDQEWGMKPMNCPGHCLIFGATARSYKDLPLRMAEFGVLHRNEASGSLRGLTRVRRFQQDDAHIFIRDDQIKDEVLRSLEFMKAIYDIFGMTYKLELSTRPKKALGSPALWDTAEAGLREALEEFSPGQWKINAGDGAFYGPKIDIKVMDAMQRIHQCATVQLDFQLPIRFKLMYRSDEQVEQPEGAAEEKAADAPKKKMTKKERKAAAAAKAAVQSAEGNDDDAGPTAGKFVVGTEDDPLPQGMKRPIIVHRAMLGSVERMIAVLCEHFGGIWPFWLSPRQVMVVPIGKDNFEYAEEVAKRLEKEGFYSDFDVSGKSLKKKVREAIVAKYNFVLCVGADEQASNSVNVRTRAEGEQGRGEVQPLEDVIAKFKEYRETKTRDV